MISTTTPQLEGKKIIEYKEIVFGEVISGMDFVKDFAASFTNFFGGRSKSYEGELIEARQAAIAEMEERAARMGANAVVGVDVDYEVLGQAGSMMMVTVSGKLRNDDKLYSWSKTILVNKCKKMLKDKKKIILIDEVRDGAYEENTNQKDDEIILEEHLSKLSEKHQEVLKLRYFLDLDYSTISKILKVPLGTDKSRISIGLNKLRKSLGGEGYERN